MFRVIRLIHLGPLTVALLLVASACAEEPAVEIDLNTTVRAASSATSSTTEIAADDNGQRQDPNAEQNRITRRYAEQQCLDDPKLDQGYVQIVDPSTNEKVGEVTVDCEEVRSAQSVEGG